MSLDDHVGFTGTRDGMTTAQTESFWQINQKTCPGWFHHGDCVGADADAHQIARRKGLYIALHPPSDSSLRAFCDHDVTSGPKPYLVRNRDIVDASSVLVACPGTMKEEKFHRTWYTIRYALSIPSFPVVIIWPDGQVEMRYGE